MMAPPIPGLFLLTQPGLGPIPDREVEDSLPDSYKTLPRTVESLDLRQEIEKARQSCDFSAVQQRQEEAFRTQLKPRLERHADYRILYFGNAPIPLAMHLGALIGTLRPAEVFVHHHSKRLWSQTIDVPTPQGRPLILPTERDRTKGDAVVRVSTSHKVDRITSLRCVPDPLVEIDVELEDPQEDAFGSGAEMINVADDFKRALDAIADRFTGVHRIHVFASVQPGLAFLLGTRISQTMHPPIQCYEYKRDRDPPHYRSIEIHGVSPVTELHLNDGDRKRAAADRHRLALALERLCGMAESKARKEGQSFVEALLSPDLATPFSETWRHLPSLGQTPLPKTSIDEQATTVPDSFRLEEGRWQLDDRWLARLYRRLPDDEARLRALRMLLLHEAVHRGRQALTSENSEGIGRFARVLEEMDYQADVWTMLHEYTLARETAPKSVAKPGEFFQELIRIATETMWAFDEAAPRREEIQVRRLHRYLIWYWQAEILRHGTGDGTELSPVQVFAMLAQRPTVELAGPELKSQDERVFFLLDHVKFPELAIYDRGELHRFGERPGLKLTDILEGIKRRDGQQIRKVLRGAVPHTQR